MTFRKTHKTCQILEEMHTEPGTLAMLDNTLIVTLSCIFYVHCTFRLAQMDKWMMLCPSFVSTVLMELQLSCWGRSVVQSTT